MTDTVSVRYAPGSWLGINSPALWAIVEMSVEDPRVAALWEAADSGVDDVLDVLLQNGLRALPGFAIVTRDSQQCVVRSPGRVLSVVDGRSSELSSMTAGGWSTETLPAACTSFVLTHADADEAVSLPTEGGIVAARALAVSLHAAGDASALAPVGGSRSTVPPRHAEGPVAVQEQEPDDTTSQPVPAHLSEATDDDETTDPDQVSTYYDLLVATTGDRNRLIERLRAEQEAPPEDDSVLDRAADEPAPIVGTGLPPGSPVSVAAAELAQGTTVVWRDEPDAVAQLMGSEVIDGVPWGASPKPLPATPSSSAISGTALDEPVEPPAAAPAAGTRPLPIPATPPPVEEEARTMSRADLLRQLTQEHGSGPSVLAVRCASGHLSPPYSATCRVCRDALSEQAPTQVPRPVLGRLVLSTGSAVELDKGVIFGRAPHSEETNAADRPNLVRLSESGMVSRQHASITLDGWQVLLRDLGSENGTIVTPAGGEPELIRPHEDYSLEPGAVVSFAEIVSFTYEVTA